jgi:hypothetical protein
MFNIGTNEKKKKNYSTWSYSAGEAGISDFLV